VINQREVEMRKAEQNLRLGQFVRAKRESLQPSLTAGRRQRTPGLRREELALRAGISTVWCAWIEQGRSTGISTSALSRLATALELTEDERHTLFVLAGKEDGDARGVAVGSAATVPARIAGLISGIAFPAYVLDGAWNAVAWNEEARALFPGWLGKDCDRNLLRYAFLNQEPRRLLDDWRDWARWIVGDFRHHIEGRRETSQVRDLINLLLDASETFASFWNEETEPAPAKPAWTMRPAEHAQVTYVASELQIPDAGFYLPAVLIPVSGDEGARPN
jgi:transcriptional regulator with XRE-family HTH domain